MKYSNFLFLIFIFYSGLSFSLETQESGEFSLQYRHFENDGQDSTQDFGVAYYSRFESKIRHENYRAKFVGFARVDEKDPGRDVWDVEDAWIGYRKASHSLRLGYQVVNWSSTEAFHPADVINSRNLDSDIENADKLGELMLRYTYTFESAGKLSLLLMPEYRNPQFPSQRSRIGFGFEVGEPLWLDRDGISDEPWGAQYALLYELNLGGADIAVHYLRHMDRTQPVFTIANSQIRPVYWEVEQYGLTGQMSYESWVFKLESVYRDFIDESTSQVQLVNNALSISQREQKDHGQVATGVEYLLGHGNGKESTFLVEYQKFFGTDDQLNRVSFFQNDVLLGYRLAWNNVEGSELFLSLIADLERSNEYLYNINFSERISNDWKYKIGARIVDAPVKGTSAQGLEFIDDANQFYFDLTRFF